MKLEELCCYLPYELKAILTCDHREEYVYEDWVTNIEIFNEGSIWQFCGFADKDLCIPLGEGEINGFILMNRLACASFYGGYKPVLRPLSDIPREITHNGETFVPIVELAKIEANGFKSVLDYGLTYTESDGLKNYYCEFMDEFGINTLHVSTTLLSLFTAERGVYSDSPRNQLQLFQKLFEFHFWLGDQSRFGVDIIDINTLTK